MKVKIQNKRILLTIAAMFAMILIVSCADLPDADPTPTPSPTATGTPEETPSETPQPSPTMTPSPEPTATPSGELSDKEAVVESNNNFAFDLYEMYRENDDNVFFSPYSITTAFAMCYEGSRGTTAEEIKEVMHYPNDIGTLRNGASEIYNEMNQPNENYMLSTANALWAQEDYPFLDEYLNNVADYYGGNTTNLDFESDPDGATEIINSWVEEKTYEKIKDLIPQGVITAMTRLVLTNAVYFKGDWLYQFNESKTEDQDFTTSSGETVKVPMMQNTKGTHPRIKDGQVTIENNFNYAENDDLQILELIYKGEEISMLILLPKDNDLSSLEDQLSQEKLDEWKGQMSEQEVYIYLPRFELDLKYMMAQDLIAMGMPTPFSTSADFSGMDGSRLLQISDVIHQAYIKVDEEGTEAAAATAIVMRATSIEPPSPTFRADHPFIFMIQERETGNILFMGRVNDPR
jgi:serpin B